MKMKCFFIVPSTFKWRNRVAVVVFPLAILRSENCQVIYIKRVPLVRAFRKDCAIFFLLK